MWVAPTKTLKCNTLEEVYLLLKSSDRIAKDLNAVKSLRDSENPLPFCLVLKQWRDINPCTEFRCFVMDNELIGNSSTQLSFPSTVKFYSILTPFRVSLPAFTKLTSTITNPILHSYKSEGYIAVPQLQRIRKVWYTDRHQELVFGAHQRQISVAQL